MIENTEAAMKKGQSRKTGNIGHTRRKHEKTKYNMCWTPLYTINHK